MNKPIRQIDDPEYLAGSIEALRAVIIGIADRTMEKADFFDAVRTHVERARTAIVYSQTSDAFLQGLNDTERSFLALE